MLRQQYSCSRNASCVDDSLGSDLMLVTVALLDPDARLAVRPSYMTVTIYLLFADSIYYMCACFCVLGYSQLVVALERPSDRPRARRV